MLLSDASILLIPQLQTQQVMTSQTRSHIKYLIQTYHILLLILWSKLMKHLALIIVFFGNRTTRRQINSRSVKSRTGQFAD